MHELLERCLFLLQYQDKNRMATIEFLDKNPQINQALSTHLELLFTLNQYLSLQKSLVEVPQSITTNIKGPFRDFWLGNFDIAQVMPVFEASIALWIQGNYPVASMVLRVALELIQRWAFGRVALELDPRDFQEISSSSGKRVTQPRIHDKEPKQYRDALILNNRFRSYDQKYPLLPKIKALYAKLSNYIHAESEQHNVAMLNIFDARKCEEFIHDGQELIQHFSILTLILHPSILTSRPPQEGVTKKKQNGMHAGPSRTHQFQTIFASKILQICAVLFPPEQLALIKTYSL